MIQLISHSVARNIVETIEINSGSDSQLPHYSLEYILVNHPSLIGGNSLRKITVPIKESSRPLNSGSHINATKSLRKKFVIFVNDWSATSSYMVTFC